MILEIGSKKKCITNSFVLHLHGVEDGTSRTKVWLLELDENKDTCIEAIKTLSRLLSKANDDELLIFLKGITDWYDNYSFEYFLVTYRNSKGEIYECNLSKINEPVSP